MASSTELPRPKQSIVGAFRQARISCSHGKPRNSSPTGNDCRKARPTVSNFSKTAFPCLETKLARSFFSFHRTSGRTQIGSVSFSKMLSSNRRYSFEFRDPSWYAPRILKMLAERNISLCLSDHHDAPAPWRRTADFVYVRGHGPGGRYRGHYADRTLIEWARRIRSWKKQGKDVYIYFDNDQKSAAPADALKLRRMSLKHVVK